MVNHYFIGMLCSIIHPSKQVVVRTEVVDDCLDRWLFLQGFKGDVSSMMEARS